MAAVPDPEVDMMADTAEKAKFTKVPPPYRCGCFSDFPALGQFLLMLYFSFLPLIGVVG